MSATLWELPSDHQAQREPTPISDLSDAGLAKLLSRTLKVTTDPRCVGFAKTIVICVPTPLGEDNTPERVNPGDTQFGFRKTPKVVGGLTERCGDVAVAFYGQIVDEVVRVNGPREAEMTKLLENPHRHVNIALINEMAVFSHEMNIDLWQAIDAAATKPFGFQPFYPGPGVGGHCIPIDPSYLSWAVRRLGYPFRFVELAQEIIASMPSYVLTRITRVWHDPFVDSYAPTGLELERL